MDSADADEKDRTSTLIPATQQLGFALGAALSGLIANGIGLSTALSPERLKVVTVWLFIGFLPCALAGIVLAWNIHPANDDCGAGGVWGGAVMKWGNVTGWMRVAAVVTR